MMSTTLNKTNNVPAAAGRAGPVLALMLMLFTAGNVVVVDASPEFQVRIPNGANVVGLDGSPWPAVGHGVPYGSATSFNPFGLAFNAAGKMWTVDLCQQDSDGDGMTNGQELGDPDCVWQPGATPSRTTDITHPGLANSGTTSTATTTPTTTNNNGGTGTGTEDESDDESDDESAASGSTSASGSTTSSESASAGVTQLSLPPWLITHIACMTLSWGFFLPIGALMAISFRGTFNSNGGKSGGTQLWFKLHVAIQILGLLLSIVGFVIVFINIDVHFEDTHEMFGVVIFSFGLAQGMMGFLRPHKPSKGEESSTLRTIWEYCHKGFGRIVIVLAWTNIFLGVKLIKSDYAGLPAGTTDNIYMGMNILLGLQAALCFLLTTVSIIFRNQSDTKTTSSSRNGKQEAGKSHEQEFGGSSQMNTTVHVPNDLEDPSSYY